MSKCVLYEPAVRVPLIIRPPDALGGRVEDALVEHMDVPATIREIAGAPAISSSAGRSLLGYLASASPAPRAVSVSENWGFAAFQTERHKLVVDEDAGEPCQLFDLGDDPNEDANRLSDPQMAAVVEELMERHVRPFLATPPARPHPSLFTPADDGPRLD